MEWSLVLSAVFIFLLRMADVTLGTLRTLVIFRGYRLLSWFMSFGQSLIFVIAVRQVIVSAQSWMEGYLAGRTTGPGIQLRAHCESPQGHAPGRSLAF